MTDPLTAAAAAAAGKSVAKALTPSDKGPSLLKRVLGPPADALGQAFANYIEYRGNNVMRILENAEAKAGPRLDEQGAVPPRVAGRLLDEGSWCDDALMVDYLGGALASARTPEGRDDRSARWTALVTRLSAYEIRAHYIVYRAMRDLYRGQTELFREGDVLSYGKMNEELRVVMPLDDFVAAMEFGASEEVQPLLAHALAGLDREGLVSNFAYGGAASLRDVFGARHLADAWPKDKGFLYVAGNPSGAELFLFAHGQGARSALDFVQPDWSDELRELTIPPTPGAMRTTEDEPRSP